MHLRGNFHWRLTEAEENPAFFENLVSIRKANGNRLVDIHSTSVSSSNGCWVIAIYYICIQTVFVLEVCFIVVGRWILMDLYKCQNSSTI